MSDGKKEYYEVTCIWQSGETIYDCLQEQFEVAYKDEVVRILRIKSYNKKNFKFWVRKITICREDVKDIIL